jgi:hypothetical protein
MLLLGLVAMFGVIGFALLVKGLSAFERDAYQREQTELLQRKQDNIWRAGWQERTVLTDTNHLLDDGRSKEINY